MLEQLISGGGMLASALLPYELSEDAIGALKSMGPELGAKATQLGSTAAGAAEFTPFAVTTGLAETQVSPEGGYTQTLAEQPQAIQEGLLQQALGAIPGTQVSPDQLYSQIQAMRQPGYDRDRLALEQRLAAQGRLGTSSMMYGGATPELLAMEESRRQQETADILSSLTQAGALTGQNIQNIQGMLSAGYTPQAQALATLQPAAQFANIAQAGRQGQSEALYKGGIAGLEAQTAGITGAASLEAARVRALADALGAAFMSQESNDQDGNGIPDWIEGLV